MKGNETGLAGAGRYAALDATGPVDRLGDLLLLEGLIVPTSPESTHLLKN
ncbi:hypothetical protein XMA134_001101 [Aliiroseovarius sp. xm-a-134]|nr:hypothetical protein [Aliiroseovarius sp. xm-m-314]NRP78992.1 hypothetical protein [Aliiroseovarius sp. xm-v-209]NRP91874.1 hypothetical protein [Aliiroseovarius sp. xm-a-134]NRQ10000.1 hypothetical protein [Aliiroseovarius sp. xm-v-208]